MNIWNRSTRIPEIYGTIIALGLIVYFFAMYALGLLQVIELRLLNLLIMLGGVYYAMKQFSRTHHGHMNYFRGLAIGVSTSAIGSSTFALFLFFFLRFDKGLMQYIIEHEPMGPYLNAYIASFMVLLEGIFSGLFITFVLLNWVHSDQVNEPSGTSS
ncbi:MAG TPA: hypothetical protein VIN08_10030 [Ohtaekwangia sp.]|uniref:hypothetical protein n=1 Tax=Ohtaekwangia sp. TaxID=2066019 RepID=UPI002F93F05A